MTSDLAIAFTAKQRRQYFCREVRNRWVDGRKGRLKARAGRPNEYRKLLRIFYKSYAVKVAALYKANKSVPWRRRLTDEEILREAETLNPWQEEPEEVRPHQVRKDDGDHRIILICGIRRHARSVMQAWGDKAGLKFDDAQYTIPGRGGRNQAVADLAEALQWMSGSASTTSTTTPSSEFHQARKPSSGTPWTKEK
jgi:hypothetical protein